MPVRKHQGDQLQSTLIEYDDIRNLLTPGSRVESESIDKSGRQSQKDVQKIRSDELPDTHSNVVHLRTGLRVGIMPNEPGHRDWHWICAGHTEHLDWKSY